MKKTGFIPIVSLSGVLCTMLLTALLVSPGVSASSEQSAGTTASSASSTTASATASSAAPASSATEAPATTLEPPVTEPPIVQPEPEPIENSVFLTHATPLRAGTDVTFTFSCRGEDVRALQGSITYDDTLLTYKGVSTLDSSWLFTVDPSEGKLVYIGLSTEAEGASGVSSLFSLTFTLNADAVTGNAIPFHVADATALKGTSELTFTGGPCTFLVDRPISENNTLTALTVGTGTLAPAFSPNVTEYRLQVPYDCTALEISAMPSAYASVEIDSPALEVGSNTVTLTVTAESGVQKIYTITVTRQSDPNYKPSTDSLLSSITLSDGMLFPAFSPSVTEYTVYLVNEGGITLTPAPAALGTALPVTLDGTDGATCTLTSIAEDGTSTTVYTFTVLRVQFPDGQSGQPTEPSVSTDHPDQTPTDDPATRTWLFAALLAVVAVSLFIVGFAIGSLTGKKKKPAVPAPAPDTAESETDSAPSDDEAPSDKPASDEPNE